MSRNIKHMTYIMLNILHISTRCSQKQDWERNIASNMSVQNIQEGKQHWETYITSNISKENLRKRNLGQMLSNTSGQDVQVHTGWPTFCTTNHDRIFIVRHSISNVSAREYSARQSGQPCVERIDTSCPEMSSEFCAFCEMYQRRTCRNVHRRLDVALCVLWNLSAQDFQEGTQET